MQTHQMRISFGVATRMDFENELLVAFFSTFKGHGITLQSEPKFSGYGGQQWVEFSFVQGIKGEYVYIYEDDMNVVLIKFEKTSSIVSETEFAKTAFEVVQNTANLPATGGSVRYSGSKLDRNKNLLDWPEFEAAKPPRRTYM